MEEEVEGLGMLVLGGRGNVANNKLELELNLLGLRMLVGVMQEQEQEGNGWFLGWEIEERDSARV